MSTWYGLVGPANMPAAVLQLLSKAAVQTVNEPEFKERLIAQGFDPKGSSPEEFSAFIQAESVRWAAILKEMKVKIE
jgi:tripartite-type tricarboxylate transporter receptor subunit TctC